MVAKPGTTDDMIAVVSAELTAMGVTRPRSRDHGRPTPARERIRSEQVAASTAATTRGAERPEAHLASVATGAEAITEPRAFVFDAASPHETSPRRATGLNVAHAGGAHGHAHRRHVATVTKKRDITRAQLMESGEKLFASEACEM